MPVNHSTGWKTITLKIHGTSEMLQVPVMIAAKISDVRRTLAQQLELDNPNVLEFHCKTGCSFRRMRPSDECQCNVIVKGIKSFGKPKQVHGFLREAQDCLELVKRHSDGAGGPEVAAPVAQRPSAEAEAVALASPSPRGLCLAACGRVPCPRIALVPMII
mmetsp:Transcript_70989/g.220477  ORF Transcript_70989/g.220477 Transcript_70989/m.220477 type:complete len:161 (+) Transcript_70989:254-736(+)